MFYEPPQGCRGEAGLFGNRTTSKADGRAKMSSTSESCEGIASRSQPSFTPGSSRTADMAGSQDIVLIELVEAV